MREFMNTETKIGRLMFRRKMRMEMIEANEREIERRKSFNKNFKEQIKQINREIDIERRGHWRVNPADHIPVCTPTSQIRYCHPDGS